MNPIDSNLNIRQARSDSERVEQRAADVNRRAQGEAEPTTSSESVSITSTAAGLLSLENQLRELPGVDQARVDTIRQAISDGTYKVDSDRVVDNLLQSEAEFG